MSRQRSKGATRRSRKRLRADRPLPVLRGREQCLALIDRLLGEIQESGSALLLSGEPGIGKSALLEVASRQAEERQVSVITMAGILAEVHLPFAALELALRPLMKQVGRIPPRQQAALLAAFGVRDDTAPPDLFLVGLATLSLLTESAARKPILVLADDVHWLDRETCDVLAFVARRLRSDPVVLMAAMRDGFDRPFQGTDIHRVHLARLDNDDAATVLDAHAPGLPVELRGRLLEEAAGNPLALVELPRGAKGPSADAMPWLPLTERLERAFSGRLGELPEATRQLLLIAAENDGTSMHELLRAAAIILGGEVGLDLLAPAIAAGLVEIDGPDLRFRHPLVRSAVHQAADPVARHRVHATLAAVIGDQLDRRLWHRAAAAIGPDEELAAEHDRMAARALRRGAVAMAIEILEVAARLSGTPQSRSDRLLRAAEAAVDLGQAETMERLLQGADVPDADGHMRARVAWIREIGQPLAVNEPARVGELTRLAASAQAHGDTNLAVRLLWRAAQRCWWGNASDTAGADILAAAGELGLSADDPRRIGIAAYADLAPYGREVYDRLAAHAAATIEDPTVAWILGNTGNVVGAFDFSIRWLTAASATFREQGRLGNLARVLYGCACAQIETGDWTGALKNTAESVQFGAETGQTVWVAASTIVQAMVEGRRGQFDIAESHASQAERLLLSPGSNFWRATAQYARGMIALSAERPLEAYRQLLRIWTPGDPAFCAGVQFCCLADYVEAAVSCAQEGAAAATLEAFERRSGPIAVPWLRMSLSYCKALLAPTEQAERFFQDALGADTQRWPFRHGRCLLAYGEWLRRQRRIMDARVPLRTARDIFDALGATPWGDRARRELRAAGEASRPRAGRALDTLTPQELQIAELAAGGLSNKEIGARLYLSHRTVGYHLHRLFPKLGITTRSGLHSALAAEAGSAD